MDNWISKKKGWLNGYSPSKRKRKGDNEINGFEKTVVFVLPRCPKCDSTKVKWYGSDGKIRYYKCNECGVKFKALEKKE